MSSGLMSCVRENSPPLELDETAESASGPVSLPAVNDASIEIVGDRSSTMTSNVDSVVSADGGAVQNAEHQKKRRFHPLRNLRRIFRRRTITSVSDTPARTHMNTLPVPRGGQQQQHQQHQQQHQQQQVNSTSEKNLRSTTLASMSSVTSVSASSPSSPLTHQQLQDAYNSQSLPKSKTYAAEAQLQRDALLLGSIANSGRGKYQQKLQRETYGETSTDYDITSKTGNTKATSDMYASRTTITTTNNTASYHQAQQSTPHRMSLALGVAVLPPIGATRGRNFFTERQTLRSIGDSSHELDNSENDSGPNNTRRTDGRNGMHNVSSNSGEITDSQRSLSEGRLVDSDYSREGLSQSHDSVFSESATASSLSIVMRAELANVLRKRTRPDGSDEDLGLPRSPGSPQRRAEQSGNSARQTNTIANNTNQSEVSSVSLLSMQSNECEEFQATSTANNSLEQQQTERITRYTRSATFSSMPTEIMRHPTMSVSFNENTKDEVDLFSSDWQRLSHSAAKHKMAIRPIKKNVPTRQHRRTLQNSIPEANEDLKVSNANRLESTIAEAKAKSRSLPPGVNAKTVEQHAATDIAKMDRTENTAASMAALSTDTDSTVTLAPMPNKPTLLSETCTSTTKISSNSKLFGLRSHTSKTTSSVESSEVRKSQTIPSSVMAKATTSKTVTSSGSVEAAEPSEGGFLRRLIQRNSKRNYAKANTADELDKNVVSEPKKIPISTSCFEMTSDTTMSRNEFSVEKLDKSRSAISYGQSVEETRKGIKREIINEGKSGLSAILNNYMITPENETMIVAQTVKPKSGPAARQRYVPQDIPSSNLMQSKEDEKHRIAIPEQEVLQSTTILHGIASAAALQKSVKTSPTKTPYRSNDTTNSPQHHFEKKPKIVGLSAFQQKISRSNDSVVRISGSNNSLEAYIDEEHQVKQRTALEKSRSFRTYNEEQREFCSYVGVRSNMPSLPDLTLNLCVPNYTQKLILNVQKQQTSSSEELKDKCTSLCFDVNDIQLVKKPQTKETESFENLTTIENLNDFKSCSFDITTITANNEKQQVTTGIPKMQATVLTRVSPVTVRSDITQSINTSDQTTSKPKEKSISVVNASKKSIEIHTQQDYKRSVNVVQPSPRRPNSLALSGKTKSEEQLKSTTTTILRSIEKPNDETYINTTHSSSTKEIDRKSTPGYSSSPNSLRYLRHSSSLNENLQDSQQHQPQPLQQRKLDIPEFMKIQLNHIDQERFTGKSNVVLAKNVKETVTPTKPKASPRTPLHDENSARRLSDENVIITEHQTEASDQKESKELIQSVRKNSVELPPKSPIKKSTSTNESSCEEDVVFREKSPVAASTGNKISLQERMRLFMADAGDKDKKVDEIRNERKKSLSEEVARRLSTYGRTEENGKNKSLIQNNDTTAISPTRSPPTSPPIIANTNVSVTSTPNTPPPENHVILRKKSFGVSSTNSINNNVHKDDSTPELMKVFARRSLKIKDDDIVTLTDKHLTTNTGSKKPTTIITTTINQNNIDSDKENQSSSEEKLNKISVDYEEMASVTKIANHNLHTTINQQSNNRNSVADFRNGIVTKAATNSNNSNNNNNNINNTNDKSHLPPIKTSSNGFRSTISSNGVSSNSEQRNNAFSFRTQRTSINNGETSSNNGNSSNNNYNNYNHTNHTNSIKRTYERQSLNFKTLETNNPEPSTLVTNKPIERSATISEFKGIDQRRREWELRAKEAFK